VVGGSTVRNKLTIPASILDPARQKFNITPGGKSKDDRVKSAEGDVQNENG